MAAITSDRQAPPSGFRRWLNRTSNTRTAWLYLLPAFIVMSIITFYPLFYEVWMSTTDYNITNLRQDAKAPHRADQSDACNSNLKGSCTWGLLENYHQIFSGDLPVAVANFSFWNVLAFNLIWTFTNVPFHVVIGVLIAVLLNVKGLWFKRFYRAIYILPIVLPSLVIAVVWRNMFDAQYGAINLGLASIGKIFGISPEVFKIRWLEQVDPPISFLPLPLSYFALLITNIWLGWPFMTIVATGALQSISKEFYEAASMDGATPIQQFFYITVPLLRPAMVPAIVYGITLTFNLFNLIYFVSGGGPLRQTEILVTTAFRLVNEQSMYGVAAAFAMYIAIILLIITLITNRVSRATESYDV